MITILMATFNGEAFIRKQLDSILQQNVQEWNLIIQDDCSTDQTVVIAREYEVLYPDKIKVIIREEPSGSAKSNFYSMLSLFDSDYMMTCDQDDIWLPHKIEATLSKMKEVEARVGVNTPVLVHTDLKVVDQNEKILSNSIFKRQRLSATKCSLNHLLVQNIVTGCSMMVNRALIQKVSPVPSHSIMHDWWFALIASAFGQIGFVDEPTLLYRQHGYNEVGSKDAGSLAYTFRRLFEGAEIKDSISKTFQQAEEFQSRFGSELSVQALETLTAYITLREQNKLLRLKTICTFGFWKTGVFRKCGQLLHM
ncbi:glycosyltransferase family 2 protein [Gorillibacterium sp. CAU 1737]|uniref:glycosyltransferase family 2 protein n=1 Tax=Gorillibacterium sp. CAU 1737 TaxID=3140362 RepID=UPI003260FBA1